MNQLREFHIMKIKFWFNIFALIELFYSICASAEMKNSMVRAQVRSVNTAYTDLMLEERRFPEFQLGIGGSIVMVHGNIILGKADATFVKIDPRFWVFENNYLPAIATGEKGLSKSLRYTFQEVSPRVTDLVYDNGIYYVAYTRYSISDDFIYFEIAKIKPGDNSWKKIYQSPGLETPNYTMANGGRMGIRGEKLFFTVGDFGLDRIDGLASDIAPQNPDLPWGKVSYINLKDGTFHIYTLGHRNALGLVFLKDGTLLTTENGPQGGDEINIIKEGLNYGWPYESYGTNYGSFTQIRDNLPRDTSGNKYELPMYAFVPSVALGEIIQISGFHKKWADNLLVGSLKAMTLFHIKLNKNHVLFVEPINIGHRIRGLKQSGRYIYVLTDDNLIIKIFAYARPEDSIAKKMYKRVANKIKRVTEDLK